MFQPAAIEPVVDFLAELAGDGPALELGIGTGRIALPLAQRGVEVHGIDLSSAMVARLRAKPGGDGIPVVIGDFATARAEGGFSLAYLVFNTINNLTTQDEQVACFENVAAHLEPGGHFAIEVGVPQLQRLPPGETVRPFALTPTHLGFDEFDVARQGLISHHYELVDGAWRSALGPVPLRLAVRARPDGAARGDDARGALGRLAPRAVHERQHQARLGLAQGLNRGRRASASACDAFQCPRRQRHVRSAPYVSLLEGPGVDRAAVANQLEQPWFVQVLRRPLVQALQPGHDHRVVEQPAKTLLVGDVVPDVRDPADRCRAARA